MLKLIDRYIIRETTLPFILSLLVFTFILLIPPIVDRAEQLLAKGVPALVIAQLLLTLVPQALGITIPIAVLIGLLMALGRMSGDRETVALQACGVSLFRLLRPVLVVAALTFAATAWVMIEGVPWGNRTFQRLTFEVIADRAQHEIKPRIFFQDFPGIVLYVRDVPQDGSGWREVFVADSREADKPRVYVARQGRIVLSRAERLVDLILEDTTVHRPGTSGPETYEATQVGGIRLTLNPETVFPSNPEPHGMNEMTMSELRADVDWRREKNIALHEPVLAIQRKLAIPTACVVFALLALVLGVSSRKDGKMASFALGVGVVFGYYTVMIVADAITKGVCARVAEAGANASAINESCATTAAWSPWFPNVVLGGIGFLLFLWKSRSVERRIAIPIPSFRRRTAASDDSPAADASTQVARPSGSRRRVVLVVRFPQWYLPGPSLLDRYVVQIYLKIFGLAFVGMMGVFYIATVIDLSEKLFKGQTTGPKLLAYLAYATPQFVYYVLAISVLVATLVTIGLLTKHSELIVMRACGISLYRAAVPLVLMGILWSGVLFMLGERVVAKANSRAEQLYDEIRGRPPRIFDVANRKWMLSADGHIYFYVYFDTRRQELTGLSVYEIDREAWRLTRRTFATRAVFTNGQWQGSNGWVREFSPKADVTSYRAFEKRELPLDRPDRFVTEQPEAERMTYQQLQHYIVELQASGFNSVPYAVEMHRKVSFPLVTVVMTLLALPFAVTTGSRGALYGVGIGLVIAISYWTLMSVFAAIGTGGMMPPLLAAWAPNILFSAIAGYMLLSVRT